MYRQRFPSLSETGSEAGLRAHFRSGTAEIVDGALQWRLWYLIGSSEMRRRYARSRLGQIWIMLTSAIAVSTIGFVWSYLWAQPVGEVLPYIAVGLVVWQLIAAILIESTTLLPANSRYFHNQCMPVSTVVFALAFRHTATFFMNLIFPLILAASLGLRPSSSAFLAIPGVLLTLIWCLWTSLILSILCTRYRDIVQVVSNVIQVAIFITPVLWMPEILPARAQDWLPWNPFAVFVAIVRDPLLGREVPLAYWGSAVIFSLGGFCASLPFLGRGSRRIVYWI
ncbi:MAG: ABC transporter permease [Bradyrhizobium sp.]|nr:ABC transporter permease [Bradyrhizobium sp.]